MCQYDYLIEEKVDDFVSRNVGFTSVDIANAIKKDGTWVRNRDVASWLRRWTPTVGYGVTRTTVELDNGDEVQASVYLPSTLSVSDYTETSQTAMTPAEFSALHGVDPFGATLTTSPAPVATGKSDTVPADGDDGANLAARLKGALQTAKKTVFNFRNPS